ncbi:MAG TPA: DUF6323 family protein [Bacillota bacterium]|nr:DUF6323 family protein [Bacillota bacterium]HOR86558.1 DUF6323 family protein [Bacillota bacterium]HPL53156.1 DUF6323 family protein [Bacillota bacterium]
MKDRFSLTLIDMQKIQTADELRNCNELTLRYGLSLTEQQIHNIVEKRFEALRDTGRMEFDRGILKKLIYEFCDSPYISQDNYEDTILELQDSFYYFKNESMELISDDELISFMKQHFDTVCQGSLEYLSGTSLEELCRNTRYGYRVDDKDVYGRPF